MAFDWEGKECSSPKAFSPIKLKTSISRIRTLMDGGIRLELDIPESNLAEVALLLALRNQVLDVEFRPEDQP